MEKGYNTVLTIILVISIAAIIVLAGFWGYDAYIKYKTEQDALKAIEEFQNMIMQNQNNTPVQNEVVENTVQQEPTVQEPEQEPEQPITNTNKPTTSGGNSGNYNKYKNFTILGQIEIPKTKVSYPVLAESSPKALNVAVSQLYGPGLNKIGNTVIIGHNNRNGLFFSNNKKLSIGDVVYITDSNGNKLTYKIYNKYETTDTDTEYMTRDTMGTREISLSTCTDDGSRRIVIWARAD